MGDSSHQPRSDAAQAMVKRIEQAARRACHHRDHRHEGGCCHPHAVEEVFVGDESFAVCHDCGFETGRAAHRDVSAAIAAHRDAT